MDNLRPLQLMAVQKEGLELFKKKNADYGDSFATYGAVGVIVRMGDKISRLSSVTKNGVNLVNTESIRDTLIDLHNYSAMAVMLLDEITAHLDSQRRDALFNVLGSLGSQIWMTGTDVSLFKSLEPRAQFFRISDGAIC